MFKTTAKYLLSLTFFVVFAASRLFAQATITIGAVDVGPYSPGSTIAIPFKINDATGCIAKTNTFTLYRSDASGDLTSPVQVGTPVSAFYATYINFPLPTGGAALAAGNYKFIIKASTPGVAQSAPSNGVDINTTVGTSVVASTSTTTINAGNPEVFGRCGNPLSSYTFSNTSTGATNTTITIYDNQYNQVGTSHDITSTTYPFSATPTNYTVIARSINAAGTVSTRAYQLINNPAITALGSGGGVACIDPITLKAVFTFNIDPSVATGIGQNYPGDLYTISWGDGSTTTYTACELLAVNGHVTHDFTTPSCGQQASNGQNNRYSVNLTVGNSYCGSGSAVTGYAAIVVKPVNKITGPAVGSTGNACTGSTVRFTNNSSPGPNANSPTLTCADNPDALYTWLVDGIEVLTNVPISTPFDYVAVHGTHTITLRDVTGNGGCFGDDVSYTLCVEDPPTPSFTIPTGPICKATPVTPTNTTVFDAAPCAVSSYNWSVNSPNYTLGTTTLHDAQPQFTFTQAGVYTISLTVTSICGTTIVPFTKTISVDETPQTTLSPNFSLCGKDYKLTFDATAGDTQTIFSGTGTDAATTYTWTIGGGLSYTFEAGFDLHSKNPQITFNNFGTYTVSVTHTNSCGSITKMQQITFAPAPTVSVPSVTPVCEAPGVAVHITGTIGGTAASTKWTMDSPASGHFVDENSVTTDYIPSALDFQNGYVTLKLHALNTGLGTCDDVFTGLVISLVKTTTRTSATTKTICSGSNVNYTITTNNDNLTPVPIFTYAWTAAVTGGNVTGFTAAGTTQTISDILVNSDPTVAASVTYHITPSTNGCPGTPFDLVVSLNAVPIIVPTAANATICSGSAAGITTTTNLTAAGATRYKWTFTISAPGITGANNRTATFANNANIADVLVNTTNAPITVTYTITPYNANLCEGTPQQVSVIVNPPTPAASIAGTATQSICDQNAITLIGNTPGGSFTGQWTQVPDPGVPTANIVSSTNPTTVIDGLVSGFNYTFKWTINGLAPCGPTSASVLIIDNLPSVGGTTAAASSATVCYGTNGDQINLSGQRGTVVRWEASIDNGAHWTTVINTTASLIYSNLTTTTQYRAVVQNGNCTEDPSAPTTITVNPLTPQAAITGTATQSVCDQNAITLTGNTPGGSFTGQWTQVPDPGVPTANIVSSTNPTTVIDGLVSGFNYTFKWTINGLAPCGPTSASVLIIDNLPSVGGTTAAASSATVCYGTNGDQINLSGQRGTVVRWEASIDNGAHWTTVINTTASLIYSNLTTTTQYRAVVQNGNCTEDPSAPTTITVNPLTPQATITGTATQSVCDQNAITLTGNTPGGSFTGQWTQVPDPGVPTANIVSSTNPTTVIDGLVSGFNYTFKWTINGLAPCGPTSASVLIIDNLPTVGGTTSSVNTPICAGSNTGTITLANNVGGILRWESSTDNFATIQVIANTTVNITFTNLTQTTKYRAVVRNFSCNQEYSTVTTITVNPPVPPAVAGANQVWCNVTSTQLDATPPGGAFIGQWTQTGGPTATVNIVNPNDPKTMVTGLIGDNVYTFQWSILADAPCTNTVSSMTVDISAATVAGNTIGGATVCAGDNNGQVTLTGHHGRVLYWEKSENSGATWVIVNNTTTSVPYLNLIKTTLYRAYVQNGSCNILTSPLVVVTVNQPPPPADAGINQILCNQTVVNLLANDPGTFPGRWMQTSGPTVAITSPTSFQTTATGLVGGNSYTFMWTITAQLPCVDTYASVTITNKADVVTSFTSTAKIGCGDLTVHFTNTSNNQVGANFIWNFGDGQTSSLASPQHTFAQRNDGRDTTYYISLGVIGNCIERPAIIDSILVRPATPIARVLPASTNGCGNFALEVRNISPGNNTLYDFYLYDGSTLVQKISKTDKTNVIFDPITTAARKIFTLYMVATGYCNNTNESTHIPIAISPSTVVAQMVIKDAVNSGCAPLSVTFVNNSFGGDNFFYTIYDSDNRVVDKPIGGLASLPYIFTKAGTYYVTLTAVSSCGFNESPRTRVDVYPKPTPNFVADVTTGCKDALITFTNNTVSNDAATQTSSLLYDWNFGDGSPHSALFAPSHGYHYTGTPYTVTLTVTNTTSGCSEILVRTDYIKLYGPPKTSFTVKPDSVTSIPNYSFSFVDETPADAVSWKWTFGDGQTSTRRNPTVTYPDTGTYKVTLTTATTSGCDSTITKKVRIGGVPGQLFLPNAFIPDGSTTELRVFMAKGSGIKEWHLQIFNNYGQIVWETTKLSPKGEPEEGWDGTFKGVPLPQGVYQWQASASFINGTEWKGNAYRDELPKTCWISAFNQVEKVK